MPTQAPHTPSPNSSRSMTERELLARLEAVLDSTLDPIITIDSRGAIVSVSKSIERVFGYKPDELVGRNVSVLMPEPHRSAHDGYLARYRQTGVTGILGRTRAFEAARRDGSVFPIEISVSRVDVPGEEFPLFTGIIHDVSERHRAEAELRLIQELSLALGEATDLNSALLMTLQRVCEVTGWDCGEAWVPDADGQLVIEASVAHRDGQNLDRFVKASSGMRFGRGDGLPGRVWQTGRYEWLDDLSETRRFGRAAVAHEAGLRSGVGLPILAESEVVAVVVFYMRERSSEDERRLKLVSAAMAPLGPAIQRKRMQDALAESERRFRDMLGRIQLISVILDTDGAVTYCNDYFLSLTKWQREEIIGRNWFETVIPEEDRERTFAIFRDAIATGSIPPHFENAIMTRSGRRRLVAWNNSMICDGKRCPFGVAGIGVDITDQRRVEQELNQHRANLEGLIKERTEELLQSHEQLRQADRLASIGTLAAGLGHDMNNVLLPMRCRLDAAESLDLPGEAREELAIVRRLCDYLQQLSDGLHLLALDPEDGEASQATTDLAHWWDQVGVLFHKALPRHARFESEIEPDLPPLAVAPHRLTQAVLNLLVNAGEAISPGGIVTFSARLGPEGSDVQIRVRDNGRGMTPEVQRRAFDPFFTTKSRGLGTGMGLSLVRGVAQSAGGKVFLESQPGRGTVIGLDVPLARPVVGDGVRPRTARVALSEPRLATLVWTMLEADGFEVQPGEPGDAVLWVIEPNDSTLAEASRLLSGSSPRQIVVCGPAPEAWEQLDVFHITQADDFEQVRSVLRDAIDAYEGALT